MKEKWQRVESAECVQDLERDVFVCFSKSGKKLFEAKYVPLDRPSIHGDYKLEPTETREISEKAIDLTLIKAGKTKEVKRSHFELYQRVK